MGYFDEYFKALRSVSADEITEHSHRSALENLFNAIAGQKNESLRILHEPKRHKEYGAPDFRVNYEHSIIGYIENKKTDDNLDKVLKSPQLKKYVELSDNILLTNYLDWVWIKDGKIFCREKLCYPSDLESAKFKPDAAKCAAVGKIIEDFFSQPPKGISDSRKLASVLAVRARHLREYLQEELERQEKDDQTGKLFNLYEIFRRYVFEDIKLPEFADAFGQNIVYGLFLARLNVTSGSISLYNARRYIPQTFGLIREMVLFFDELEKEEYRFVRWIVEEVLTVLNNLDLLAILQGLSFLKNNKDSNGLAIKDPYVYFYEDFLAAYDKNLRETRGVYYTPPPVVNFIVRSLEYILQKEFNIKDGFADHKRVTVLDFATGTGTFLVEVMERIFEKLPKGSGKRDAVIREHVLKNLYGFEYLIAPYTIAHLKLSQYLKDHGHDLQAGERLQVYLTNTLEPADPHTKIPLLPALSEETKAAQRVKDNPVLVITGNPPYSGHSRNPSEHIVLEKKGSKIIKKIKKTHIGGLLQSYFVVDGMPLKEKNSKWLNDDYVKFIRFAQWKMESVDEGVVGIITNHGFLDNPTFRGMRQSLMKTFNRLYLLDLHGNYNKKETDEDGGKDENVFDIQQGVAISFLVKKRGLDHKVFHADLRGLRVEKYKRCYVQSIDTIDWTEIAPASPFYLFAEQNETLAAEYKKYQSISDIFPVNSVGIVTARDELCIQFLKDDVYKVIHDFAQQPAEDARRKFTLGEDARDWKVGLAQKDLIESGLQERNIVPILYRPFDLRYTYYTGKSRGFHCMPRGDVMKHMLHENIAVIMPKQDKGDGDSYISNTIAGHKSVSAYDINYVFPLYVYETGEGIFASSGEITRKENLSPAFRQYVDRLYKKSYMPKEILGYIYAILHSPSYREKYADFLKMDFPRIPLVVKTTSFEKLFKLGTELIDAHLMKVVPDYNNGYFMGDGSGEVEKVRYVNNKQGKRIYINETQYFDKVPEEIFAFRIGGYQVLDKFLKDRKGRMLTLEEISNVERIAKIAAFTIDVMKKIDKETRTWI